MTNTIKNYRAAARLKASGGKTGTNTREGGAKSKCQKGPRRIDEIIRMLQSSGGGRRSVASLRYRSSAGSIINTSAFRFWIGIGNFCGGQYANRRRIRGSQVRRLKAIRINELVSSSNNQDVVEKDGNSKVTTESGPHPIRNFAYSRCANWRATLRVHHTTVYCLLKEKKLPAFRVGARASTGRSLRG